MREFIALLLFIVPGYAQEGAKASTPPAQEKPAAEAAKAEPKPEAKTDEKAEAKAASKDEEKAATPSPISEKVVSGSVDFGYRWVSNIAGSFNAYRSVVNLGEGPKLFNVDLTIQDPSKKLFDRMSLFANGWGGDPYNTARLDASKEGSYRLTVDYRNIAYFNFLPSFADPLLSTGQILNERSFDIQRRNLDAMLELRPGKRIVPYLAFSRNSGSGTGISPYVLSSNEYPLPTTLRDSTNNYRGGVRFECKRYHLTLEQGGTTFKDDQRVYSNGPNAGNRTTPFNGQNLVLNSGTQSYGIRGNSVYTKGLFTAAPATWIDIYSQFVYSRPETDSHFLETASGVLAAPGTLTQATPAGLTFISGLSDVFTGAASQPHTSAMFGFQLRPLRRLRIIESWMTDRYTNTSSALLAEQVFIAATTGNVAQALAADQLNYNYSQQDIQVLFDMTSHLTIRGGYRFVWGDAEVRATPLSQTGPFESGELRRQVGLAGLNFRPSTKLSVNIDFEGASGNKSYFRTSLQDYQKARMRARYQLKPSLNLQANFSVLNNENPTPNIQYAFLSRSNSVAVQWLPAEGKRVSVIGEYTRYTLRSDLNYLLPPFFTLSQSNYRDNGHSATAMIDVALPAMMGVTPRINFGGSVFVSSGSRPTNYYQPQGRFLVPVMRHVNWYAEWKYYGLSEDFYLYEGFRAHQFVTGFRLTL